MTAGRHAGSVGALSASSRNKGVSASSGSSPAATWRHKLLKSSPVAARGSATDRRGQPAVSLGSSPPSTDTGRRSGPPSRSCRSHASTRRRPWPSVIRTLSWEHPIATSSPDASWRVFRASSSRWMPPCSRSALVPASCRRPSVLRPDWNSLSDALGNYVIIDSTSTCHARQESSVSVRPFAAKRTRRTGLRATTAQDTRNEPTSPRLVVSASPGPNILCARPRDRCWSDKALQRDSGYIIKVSSEPGQSHHSREEHNQWQAA